MSRPTPYDAQGGADIALNTAALIQPDLFDAGLPDEFWEAIERAALDQLEECDALRAALS